MGMKRLRWVACSAFCCGVAAAEVPLPDQMLIDFDNAFQSSQLVVDEGRAEVIATGDGNHALQLDAAPGQRAKIRLRPAKGQWNLLEFANLTMDLKNPGEHEAMFRMLIKDPRAIHD